jgi:hypothetical protein
VHTGRRGTGSGRVLDQPSRARQPELP